MGGEGDGFRYPYTPYAGSSTPSVGVSPKEGKAELWSFFWLSLVNTLIIAVAGIVTWVLVSRP